MMDARSAYPNKDNSMCRGHRLLDLSTDPARTYATLGDRNDPARNIRGARSSPIAFESLATNDRAGTAKIASTFSPLTAFRLSLARMSTTRANACAGLAADIFISLLLLGAGLWRNQDGVVVAASIICCGLIFFSFVEYSFHRWLFHTATGPLAQGHRMHHENPTGYDALPFFVPPLAMSALAGLVATVAPTSFALLLSGALAAGYAAYGCGHTAVHIWRFRRTFLRSWAAKHHIHHYHPDKNFGVTTPIWDIVFGTRYAPARETKAHRDFSDDIAGRK